jgi:hypothetical protein
MRQPKRQLSSDRSFQIELSALTFALAIVALFYPRGKLSGTIFLAKKLRMLKPSVQEWQSSFGALMEDEFNLSQLHIGYARLTHGRLL